MPIDMPSSDLSRARSIEPANDYPARLIIVAHWGKDSRHVEITKHEFFGTGSFGAPINGDQIFGKIKQLIKNKPSPTVSKSERLTGLDTKAPERLLNARDKHERKR